jgi:hypothetical protein
MSNPIVKIYDIETGQVTEREMTDAEVQQHELDKQKALELRSLKEQQKAARNAVLEKLGLTEEEIKLLISTEGK